MKPITLARQNYPSDGVFAGAGCTDPGFGRRHKTVVRPAYAVGAMPVGGSWELVGDLVSEQHAVAWHKFDEAMEAVDKGALAAVALVVLTHCWSMIGVTCAGGIVLDVYPRPVLAKGRNEAPLCPGGLQALFGTVSRAVEFDYEEVSVSLPAEM